ncbi:MAG: tetratricopeptide repeat protein [Roseinatronobacter sp.]
MTSFKTGRVLALTLAATLALAACESSEDRAERHFNAALELVERGDVTRALLELRNVFRHDGTHLEARRLFADLNLEQGDIGMAMRHYLLLSEQDPDNIEVRHILAEAAIDQNNWEDARRHGDAALELDPDAPRSVLLGIALDYREAVRERDAAAQSRIFQSVAQRIEDQPDEILLRRIAIDYLISSPEPASALPEIEAALTLRPRDERLHYTKVRLLHDLGETDAVTEQLELMFELFPNNEEIELELVRWYMTQDRPDLAEAFLRAQAEAHPDETDRKMTVVGFLESVQGQMAARAELERLVQDTEDAEAVNTFRAALALLDFRDGATDRAMSTLESIIADTEQSDTQRELRIQLAGMYLQLGREDDARTQVTTILEQDRTHVAALVQRATWSLQDGELLQAQSDLRSAQAQDPNNPLIMTFLAAAFARDGSIDLAGEQLARAVQASNNRAAETLRYVAFLREQGRTSAIEPLLSDALRIAPSDIDLLTALAEHYLRNNRWSEAGALVNRLADTAGDEGQRRAQQLRAAILLGQNQIDEGLSVLQDQVRPGDEDVSSVAVVLSAQVRAGRSEAARAYIADLIADQPDSAELRLLSANLDALLGNAQEAEASYRAVLDARPDADNASVLLYGLLRGEGRDDDAEEVLDAALTAAPNSIPLLLIRARELEDAGEFDEAIGIYEQMQALAPNNIVAANNLASMLTTYRESEEDLARAAELARPLRDSTIPAFQDTYGWIAFRLGNLEEARVRLEPAAESLPNEPLVQYHLGRLLIALEREEEAIPQLERAIELMQGRDLPQLASARAHLEALRNPPAAN